MCLSAQLFWVELRSGIVKMPPRKHKAQEDFPEQRVALAHSVGLSSPAAEALAGEGSPLYILLN